MHYTFPVFSQRTLTNHRRSLLATSKNVVVADVQRQDLEDQSEIGRSVWMSFTNFQLIGLGCGYLSFRRALSSTQAFHDAVSETLTTVQHPMRSTRRAEGWPHNSLEISEFIHLAVGCGFTKFDWWVVRVTNIHPYFSKESEASGIKMSVSISGFIQVTS
jgi:hypothetical protein